MIVVPAHFTPSFEHILYRHSRAGGNPDKKEKQMKQPAVYILASQRNGTLYIGVTSNLIRRFWEHKNNFVEGFTNKYHIHYLVYYELHSNMQSAILREKQLKKWNREWKLKLLEEKNPTWKDLWNEVIG